MIEIDIDFIFYLFDNTNIEKQDILKNIKGKKNM